VSILISAPEGTADPARPLDREAINLEPRLSLLGSFSLYCDGERVTLPGTTQRLLAFLALCRTPVHRVYVAGTLWPETTERRANGNLRTTLWRLSFASGSIVDSHGDCLALDPRVEVDLYRVVALSQGLMRGEIAHGYNRIGSLMLTGELLPGWYDEWVVPERESFRELRLHALEQHCRDMAAMDRFGDAIEAGLAAVAGDPLRESSRRALIGAYLREGNHAQALRQYRQYRDDLELELGVTPSRQMASLFDEHGLAIRT
jgi:DNA-binding SARP family transcriptional activator